MADAGHRDEQAADGSPNSYEPRSKLAGDVLLDRRFKPLAEGLIAAEELVRDLDASKAEVELALAGLEEDGLVRGQTYDNVRGLPKGRLYTATALGWRASECVWRARGLRHTALLRQREHSLADLILAIVMSAHIDNQRIRSGFWASDTKRAAGELEVYLCEYPSDEITSACGGLVSDDLLVKTTKHRTGGDVAAFDITSRGQRAYENEVVQRLRIAEGRTILDPNTRIRIILFDAWQSEYKPARNAIAAVLPEVVDAINTLDGLAHPIEITQATAAGEGAIRIDATLQEKIRKADFFVGDLTAVYAYSGRLRVNENVLVEVGFALASKDSNQIILLAMRRNQAEVPGDGVNAMPTFDISHIRRTEFTTKDELRSKLRKELEAALRVRGWLR